MAFSDDLLSQAAHLAARGPGRPRQADLRRAVSAAYYAMFHEISDRAVRSILRGADARGRIGSRVRRAVSHASVLKACKWMVGTTPDVVKSMLPHDSGDIPSALRLICRYTISLQGERHRADYDFSAPFTRSAADASVAFTQLVLSDFRGLPDDPAMQVFLLGCLFGDSLVRNV